MQQRGGDKVRMDLHDYACLIMSRGRPGAPERHRNPLGRATVPRPPHTAALRDPGETTGAGAKLGERLLEVSRQIITIRRSIPEVRSLDSNQ